MYIACDVCFWRHQIDQWLELIDKLVANKKQLIMCDPGRQSFWELLDYCQVPHFIERKFIKEPRKTDSYITVFGF
jgi:predicted nicotinamide N-methyase